MVWGNGRAKVPLSIYSHRPIQYTICLLFIFKTILLASTPNYPYLSNQIAAPSPLILESHWSIRQCKGGSAQRWGQKDSDTTCLLEPAGLKRGDPKRDQRGVTPHMAIVFLIV